MGETETKKKYVVLQKDRDNYICLVILNEIINYQHYFPIKLSGDDIFLKASLENMKTKGALEIKDGKYIPTQVGRDQLEKFFAKYYEFLKMFDVFCAVDTAKGEFAFSSMNSDMSDDAWEKFLNSARFSDLRVAVADFKGLNPTEIVFMSFLNENKFDSGAPQWQNKLTADAIWTEIEDICNEAVSVDYLKEQEVIEDVIKKGTDVAMQLIKEAEESEKAEQVNQSDDEEIVETTITTTEEYVDYVPMPCYGYDYWDPYYDPFYVSPFWMDPFFF